MNTRQSGYNIIADVFGYDEEYYIPPREAVSRIEMVRGTASSQFGSQFGGMVRYVGNKFILKSRFSGYICFEKLSILVLAKQGLRFKIAFIKSLLKR